MRYTKTLLAIAATAALTISCSDKDYFDKEAYDNLITEAFPVENVDPNHDWKTVGSADVKITLMQSGEGECTIRIYSGYPGDSSSKILAKQSLSNGETMATTINYLLASPTLSVVLTDQEGYSGIYNIPVEDGKIEASIGDMAMESSTTTKSRAGLAGVEALKAVGKVTYSFASDYSSYPTKAPSNTNNFTDAYSKGGNILMNTSSPDLSNLTNNGDYIYFPSGDYNITTNKINSTNGPSTLIFLPGAKATFSRLTLNEDNSGVTLVICNGAKVTIGDNQSYAYGIKIYNAGTFTTNKTLFLDKAAIFYNSGIWNAKADIKVDQTAAASTSSQIVNADTITGNNDLILGGALWNTGVFEVNHVNINFTHADISQNAWVNEGTFKTTSYFQFDSGTKLSDQIINKCKLSVGGNLNFNEENITFNIERGTEVYVNGEKDGEGIQVNKKGCTINLGLLAMIECARSIKLNKTKIEGQGSLVWDYATRSALIKSDYIDGGNSSISGCVKFAIGHEWTNMSLFYAWSPLKSCNLTIDRSACTDGYHPTEQTTYEENALSLRYCYEDNFPSPGDYDFNDIVLDVEATKINDNTVKYIVDLAAIGATKQISAALRLYGLNARYIESVTVSDNTLSDFDLETSQLNNCDFKQKFEGKNYTSDADNNAVIYLFNDAHYAQLRQTTSNGGVYRPFVNTIRQAETIVDCKEDVTPASCTITVKLKGKYADQILSASALDPFIVTEYNGSHWEVHTIDWKLKPALFTYDSTDSYKINLPWALCFTGDFKYPKEFTSIGNYKEGELSGAYSEPGKSFGEWCVNESSDATDWYNYPDDDKVYK